MRRFPATLTLLFCFLISGCGFVHDERITGPYRLIAVDIDEQMNISYDLGGGDAIGRIVETVFGYGFDTRYIVAMQHPHGDRNITNYYFLDMTRDSRYADPSESVTGPLTEKEFESVSRKLNLPKISRVIKHLR